MEGAVKKQKVLVLTRPNKERHMMIKLDRATSVVEYQTARMILIRFYDLYRKNDSELWLLKQSNRSWHEPAEDEKPIMIMNVDQGLFDYTWDGTKTRMSMPGEELVDFLALLKALTKELMPEFKPARCDYMGRGRQVSHFIVEYFNALLEAGLIEEA